MKIGRQRGAIDLIIIVIVAVAVIVGVLVIILKSHGSKRLLDHLNPTAKTASNCPDPILKTSPVQIDQISQVIPLGNLAPPGHVVPTTHMYYNYLHSGGHPVKTSIYAPADLTITRIMKMDNASLARPYDSYRLDFTICQQVTGYFILVEQLSDKLAAADQPPYDQVQTSDVGKAKLDHNYFKTVSVKINAGEIIGTAGGQAGDPDGLDLAISDRRLPAPTLANASRWPDSDRHYACSLNYYAKDLATRLDAKLGDYNGRPVAKSSNRCGSVYQDVPGSAQGVWVAPGANSQGLTDVNNQLALVHSNFDPSLGAVSVGNRASQLGVNTSSVHLFTPITSGTKNLDFNLVKPGSTVYCYDTNDGRGSTNSQTSFLLQLVDSDHLKLGRLLGSCGSGPWNLGQSLDYVR